MTASALPLWPFIRLNDADDNDQVSWSTVPGAAVRVRMLKVATPPK
jgi:hypothetical protein